MSRLTNALGLASLLLMSACDGTGAEQGPTKEQKAAEIARLEEQVKSYDLLNSITADPKAPADPEAVARRQAIDDRLAQLRAQSER